MLIAVKTTATMIITCLGESLGMELRNDFSLDLDFGFVTYASGLNSFGFLFVKLK